MKADFRNLPYRCFRTRRPLTNLSIEMIGLSLRDSGTRRLQGVGRPVRHGSARIFSSLLSLAFLLSQYTRNDGGSEIFSHRSGEPSDAHVAPIMAYADGASAL